MEWAVLDACMHARMHACMYACRMYAAGMCACTHFICVYPNIVVLICACLLAILGRLQHLGRASCTCCAESVKILPSSKTHASHGVGTSVTC